MKINLKPKRAKENLIQLKSILTTKNVDKWLAGAVLFFGIFGIVFGFAHFKGLIRKPFLPTPNNQQLNLNTNNNQADLLGLSQKDTDQDGLSDYDEIYIHATSPYLEDSDSDGLDDQKEIARGSDPNCPAGQNCLGFSELESGVSASDTNVPVSGVPILQGEASVSQLRDLLRNAGMSEEMLSDLSDEEILSAYQEVLGQSGSSGSSQSSQTVTLPVQQIEDLTPDQIRQLLREQGVSEENLSQISDAELMNLVKETLEEVQ